jgi:photosystem II stability/assembly factor-like uncharacterized protein
MEVQMALKASAAFLLSLVFASPAWPRDWYWQHPVPQGNTLRAGAVGPEYLIAAGDCGTIVRFHLRTRTWQHVASPVQKDLHAVGFVSPATWLAAGAEGTILRSTDSGLTWTRQESGTKEDLYGLAFGAPDSGMAVGSGGTVLLTQDGGRSWTRRPADANLGLRAVAMMSPQEAVAVGEHGAILKTDDAGMSWKQQQLDADLYSVVSHGKELIAVGGEAGYFRNRGVILRSRDRGEKWQFELNESGSVLYGVSIGADATATACGERGALFRRTSRDAAWNRMKSPATHLLTAVAHTPDEVLALGSFGVVLTSADGGMSWNAGFTEKQKELVSISFFDDNHGIAVGEDGLILHTADGGSSWHVSKSEFKTALKGVAMVSPIGAFAVGSDGLIVRTTDGGETWATVPSGTDIWLAAVAFADERIGLVVGYSTILATEDGGNTWKRRAVPAGVGDVVLQSVAYANPSNVAAVGSTGIILISTDGGRNWASGRSGTTHNLASVAWSDSRRATAVGDKGTILNTADGGLTWNPTPSGAARGLTGVAYLSGREGLVTGESGIILYTRDSGRTWAAEESHTLNHLRGLFCRTTASAYAAGWNATILRRGPAQPAEKP